MASHRIAEAVRYALFRVLPVLSEVTVHVDPCECEAGVEYHLAVPRYGRQGGVNTPMCSARGWSPSSGWTHSPCKPPAASAGQN